MATTSLFTRNGQGNREDMAAHAKFLFDTDFEQCRSMAAPPSRARNELAEQIAQARQDGYREGLVTGRAEAAREAEAHSNALLARLADNAEALAADLETERESLRSEAAHLALAAARALAPALIAREPHGELMALFEECVANLSAAPHLAVRVPQTDLPALRERLEATAYRTGYDGRIVVIADDGLAEGDCRIEWADGGIARSRARLEAWLAEAVARRYAPPPQEAEEEETGETADPELAAPQDAPDCGMPCAEPLAPSAESSEEATPEALLPEETRS
jgi:flagellar assembly protein FliH